MTKSNEMNAYSEAVKSGLYAKKSGLVGKYDNVRRYWEDEITRRYLRPYLKKLIEIKKKEMKRVRIIDLGCGSADGYELLRGVRQTDSDIRRAEVDLLTPDVFGLYKGIDLSQDLIDQAKSIYGTTPKMDFAIGDMTKGLPIPQDERPYDLYFTSFGTCSHHTNDDTLVDLLADIARRTKSYSVIMCDWLGRYSYEWQTKWTNDLSENRVLDYVVSYIYEKEEREQKRDQLQHFSLRMQSREEIDKIIQKASEKAGVQIKPLTFFDRGIFTGRHMDTGDYNPYAQPLRRAVNSLHEINHRTNLTTLLVNYVPREGFEFLNNYFEYLQVCWNTMINYTIKLVESYDNKTRSFTEDVENIPSSYPEPLKDMMNRMRRVVEGIGWLDMGLPRENIIEPQLGYALRYLLTSLQQGRGCAHNLVGIFEVDKS
jgi:ubiquinone/menaquinone biosynthesis C-methylase UbiE